MAAQRPEPVRLGILGLGTAGRGAADAARRDPHTEVVAVCDVDAGTSARIAEPLGARAYTEVRQLCDDTEVDAVYVSTPTFLHLAHALELASAGKHLLVEKPVVKDSAEAEAFAGLPGDFGVMVMSVNTRGRDAPVRAMAQIVESGAIGAVLSLTNICHTNWVLRPRYPYELVGALGGGVTYRQAPHQVEIARAIVDAPVRAVTALAGRSPEPVDTIGNYSALVEFDGGVSAALVYNGYGYFDTAELTYGIGEGGRPFDPEASKRLREISAWSVDKYGAAGAAARGRAPAAGPTDDVPWSFVGLTVVSGERGDLRQSPHGVTVYDRDGQRDIESRHVLGGLAVDFAEIYSALREDAPLVHDAAWGATTVKICDAIWRSHRERRRVEL